ncbi:transcriptional regulator, LysR family [Cognatiyoonia sediminum]|uniref:Transcriptional regulator, LysR family n=1 Tax=Cognatiyoonia sediminum TaxID=1508389 RepID=A0A1M5PJK1_9RHOB|nr:LysR family transcriptional regulator [Cognatiyoonia sediminum]SHH01857.1 transcriptional regulator, LysR family [Cognatiyoonia sediminum]
MNGKVPWQLLQSMAAIAEHGSLSAAAREVGVSQPTLSRHLSTLEDLLGDRLFDRTREGMALTVKGEQLFQEVRSMADTAGRISRKGEEEADDLSGTVRISASQIVATYLLPDILTELRRKTPHLAYEVVASDTSQNLIRREADIAVRMYRPRQSDLFIRKVAELKLGIFAHRDYMAGKDTITVDNFMSFDVIGYDRSSLILDGMRALGMKVDRDDFAFRSDDQVVCWNMVRAGYGLGMMQVELGKRDPNLVHFASEIDIGSMPVWLAAHKELKSSPRIRMVFDHLATSFQRAS